MRQILSDARNVNLTRAESEAQVMLKMFNMATAAMAVGLPVDWQDICKRAARTKPACIESLPIFVKLIRVFGGGSSGGFVPDFCRFHRKLAPNEKGCRREFLPGGGCPPCFPP